MRRIELANYGKMNTSFKLISMVLSCLGGGNLLWVFVVNNAITAIAMRT